MDVWSFELWKKYGRYTGVSRSDLEKIKKMDRSNNEYNEN